MRFSTEHSFQLNTCHKVYCSSITIAANFNVEGGQISLQNCTGTISTGLSVALLHRNHRLIRKGAQDGHLDFHTAAELWFRSLISKHGA